MRARLLYFSGTGCTRHVAETFQKELKANNVYVDLQDLRESVPDNKNSYDMLVICFVVHACNPPRPVMDWVEGQVDAGNIPAAVISVSGGGEITPNRACRMEGVEKLWQENSSVRKMYWMLAMREKLPGGEYTE